MTYDSDLLTEFGAVNTSSAIGQVFNFKLFCNLIFQDPKTEKKAYGPNNINISKRTGKQIFVYPSSPGRCQM